MCWISITFGTGMRVIVFGFRRAKRIDKKWLGELIKAQFYILLLAMIFVGYLITFVVTRIGNRDEEVMKFRAFEFILGGASVKTIIFITFVLFYSLGQYEVTSHL